MKNSILAAQNLPMRSGLVSSPGSWAGDGSGSSSSVAEHEGRGDRVRGGGSGRRYVGGRDGAGEWPAAEMGRAIGGGQRRIRARGARRQLQGYAPPELGGPMEMGTAEDRSTTGATAIAGLCGTGCGWADGDGQGDWRGTAAAPEQR